MKNAILITDLGMDPDDLVALMLACKSPEIKVDLIVSSQDKYGKRAEMAKYILELLNYNSKIAKGEESKELMCYFNNALSASEISADYIKSIDDIIEKNSHTYIVNMCALTEFANYLKYNEKSEIKMKKIQKKITLVQMGGSSKGNEYNFIQDPESFKYVFGKKINSFLVTKEITNAKPMLNQDDSYFVKKLKSSDSRIHKLLAQNIDSYFFPFYFHDPLTLASIIDKKIMHFEPMRINFLPNGLQEFILDKKSNIKISAYADYFAAKKLIHERVIDSLFEEKTAKISADSLFENKQLKPDLASQ